MDEERNCTQYLFLVGIKCCFWVDWIRKLDSNMSFESLTVNPPSPGTGVSPLKRSTSSSPDVASGHRQQLFQPVASMDANVLQKVVSNVIV